MRCKCTTLILGLCGFAGLEAAADEPEARQVRYELNYNDQNEDGALSFEEWRSDWTWFEENLSADRFAKLIANKKAEFAAVDLDQDGLLNFDELVAERAERARIRFEKHDRNGDGVLLIDEFARSIEASEDGIAIYLAALEMSSTDEKPSPEDFRMQLDAKVKEWGQPESGTTAILTPALNLRLGQHFSNLDLDSNRQVTLQEFTDVELGIYKKSDAAIARRKGAETSVE
ncbi:MAG: hypothetical protein AAGH90_04350 [Pseudomonadota bacterium]